MERRCVSMHRCTRDAAARVATTYRARKQCIDPTRRSSRGQRSIREGGSRMRSPFIEHTHITRQHASFIAQSANRLQHYCFTVIRQGKGELESFEQFVNFIHGTIIAPGNSAQFIRNCLSTAHGSSLLPQSCFNYPQVV